MVNLKKIYRNKLFIIGLHIIAWTCFLLLPFFMYRIRILHPWFFTREIIDNLFLIGVFYLNIYVLIPRFFTLKKIVYYFTSVLAVLVFILLQQALTDYYFVRFMADYKQGFIIQATTKDSGYRQVTFARPRAFMRYRTLAWAEDRPPVVALKRAKALAASNIKWDTRDAGQMDTFRVTLTGAAAKALPGMPMEPPTFFQHLFFPEVLRKSVVAALLMLFMGGFIKIAQQWFRSEQQREALKVEKLNAELKFLKSQINPHFLFNCLNTIYSLAHKHSAQTEHAIVKLSTIMRYMIYESNEDKVQLGQELQYLRDYIDIQRLRLPAGIKVDYTVNGMAAGLWIEPMLLIPFVENAFKHGISYAEHSFICINVDIERNVVRMQVKNSLFRQRVSEKGGIGLQNVLKRLELLYMNNHDISITETENQFIVDLKIVLKND